MDKTIQEFLNSALRLGKELLEKEKLTQNEEDFLLKLDKVTETYFK